MAKYGQTPTCSLMYSTKHVSIQTKKENEKASTTCTHPCFPVCGPCIIRWANSLTALILNYGDYTRTSLVCFTKTWLAEGVDINLNGFMIIWSDRDPLKTWKKIGGGYKLDVSNRWAINCTECETFSTKDFEIKTASLRQCFRPWIWPDYCYLSICRA